jgi:rhamnogalacturonyl hydrolase YesR
MTPSRSNLEVHDALRKLDAWVVRSNWKGYDPFDGLSSPLSGILTLNIPLLKQLWLHVVRRTPINLRPLLRVKPNTASKAMGFFAQGYLKLYQTHGQQADLQKMKFCLQWLMDHPSPGFKGYGWGNHFGGQTRGGYIGKGTPTVVWTALIGHAFLDAYEAVGDKRYLEVARGAAEFIVNELGWIDDGDAICFNYIPSPGGRPEKGKDGIHNSNVLGGGFIARVHSLLPTPRYVEMAKRSMVFTVRDQLPNGSWNYGTAPSYHWVDSFHTGYVLESLDWYARGTGDNSYQDVMQRGYRFFIETFFAEDGTPRYYDRKTTPLDIQCASQGIQSLVTLRRLDSRSISTAERVAHWTITNMQDKTGYFYYRKYSSITNKAPMLHWAQATMFAALALLDGYQNGKEGHPDSESSTREAAATFAEVPQR